MIGFSVSQFKILPSCTIPGTPLTLILGPIQNAVSETNDAKLKETLKLALRNVSRLSRLVDSLMDFSRIEAGRLLGISPRSLISICADVLSDPLRRLLTSQF